jgi:hypothetical protein
MSLIGMDSASSQGLQGPSGGGNPVSAQQGGQQPGGGGAQGSAFNDALSFLRDYLLQSTMTLLEKKRRRELSDPQRLMDGYPTIDKFGIPSGKPYDPFLGLGNARGHPIMPNPGRYSPNVDPRMERRMLLDQQSNPWVDM